MQEEWTHNVETSVIVYETLDLHKCILYVELFGKEDNKSVE